MGADTLDERSEQTRVLRDADGEHDDENHGQHTVAEGQPVAQQRVVEYPADVLGLVHREDLVADRLAAGAHGLESVAAEQDGGDERNRVERHENDHGIGDLVPYPLYPAAERLALVFVRGIHPYSFAGSPRPASGGVYLQIRTPEAHLGGDLRDTGL